MRTSAEDVEAECKDKKVSESDGNSSTDLTRELLHSRDVLSPKDPKPHP